MKKYLFVCIIFLLICILPILGSYWIKGSMPNGFGLFPAQLMEDPPGFNKTYFIAFSLFALFLTLYLVFPRFFGFKKCPETTKLPEKSAGKFPWWFIAALPVTVVSWFLMWARIPELYPVEHYTFVPLAWGFILVLDGVVYRRNNGKSLIASRGIQMKVMIIISTLSWFLFEYFNYFVNENWYYPNYQVFTNFGNIIWFFLGYSTVLPVIFEWYTLLKTYPSLANRYTSGPVLRASRTGNIIVLILGLALFFLMSIFPYLLFWAVWVALIPVFGAALSLIGKKTVLSGIGKGDWSKVNLVALATLCNGFIWEIWNFGSEWFHGFYPTTPGFWMYSVPYVDVVHIFSEMPILGYYGYLFFGVNCWILWNLAAYLLGFEDSLELV